MVCEKINKLILVSCILSALLIAPIAGLAQTNDRTSASSPQREVTGVVKSEKGTPLVGVTVVVQGTTNGVATDGKGAFSIRCASGDVLEAIYIGYENVAVSVGERNYLTIILNENAEIIDDVIVIGYGTTTRRRAIGAVDQVRSSAISDRSVANVTQALQGTSPSLVIQQRNFDPNDNKLNINIRGIGTMNDNNPLIIIDGLATDGTASFNRLNPSDIESISVLKDAGTSAIYGSKAANGVLLVTTKKGKRNQAPVINIKAMVGMQDPKLLYTPVQGYQNATLYNTALVNAGKEPIFSLAQIRDLKENGNGRFFLDEIMRDALQQNYNVSVSGGGENSTYMISAGHYDQESNYKGPGYGVQRYNFRTNITTEYKRLKVTALLSYARDNSKKSASPNIINDASRIPTYYYYRQKDNATGKYLINDLLTQSNPLGILEKGGYDKNQNNYTNANLAVDLKIIEGLKLRGVLGADIFSDHRYTRRLQTEFYDYRNIDGPPTAYANSERDVEDWNKNASLINSQIMADYDRNFGVHHVFALFGASNESYTSRESQMRLKNSDVDLGIIGEGSYYDTTGDGTYNSNKKTTKRSLTSLFGRIGYDYDNKYFAEATFRYDGSSKFNKDNRWGFFPSVSLGWRASQENFMEWYRDHLGELKLRASYGVVGNQNVNDYQYMTTYELFNDQYGWNNEIVPGAGFRQGAEDLTWETSQVFNFGVDASFFKNTLFVTFDVFNKNTKDILVPPLIPDIYGTAPQDWNNGKMRTQGWELSVMYNLNHGDFRHSFNFNIGDSWNKVVKYEGESDVSAHEEIWKAKRVGLPLNSYYGYKSAGIFQSYEEVAGWAKRPNSTFQPGDLKIMDRNKDGIINENDLYYLGNPFPRYTFGFGYNVEWKGFDFSLFLQGTLKRDMMLRGELLEPFHETYGHTMYEHQLDFWTPTNTGAKYPRLADDNTLNYGKGYGSDIFIFNAAYLRIKNIEIGYTLPKHISKKIGMERVRISANTQNPFTFSKNSFIDPESSEFDTNMNDGGANSGRNYPVIRYYGLGLDITF